MENWHVGVMPKIRGPFVRDLHIQDYTIFGIYAGALQFGKLTNIAVPPR